MLMLIFNADTDNDADYVNALCNPTGQSTLTKRGADDADVITTEYGGDVDY